jgi:hypothetical protein
VDFLQNEQETSKGSSREDKAADKLARGACSIARGAVSSVAGLVLTARGSWVGRRGSRAVGSWARVKGGCRVGRRLHRSFLRARRRRRRRRDHTGLGLTWNRGRVSRDLGLARSSSSRVSGGYRSFIAGRSFRRLRGIRGCLLTLARGAGRRNWVAGIRGRDGITAGSLRAVAGSSLGGDRDGISRGFRPIRRRNIRPIRWRRGRNIGSAIAWRRWLGSRVRWDFGLVIPITVLRGSNKCWEGNNGNLGEVHFVCLYI